MDIKSRLSEEFGIKYEYASNVVDLINEGNTIPFIARYRKEMHGGADDQLLRTLAERKEYLDNLQKRKEEIKASIEEQGKWTDELAAALENAKTMTEAEDIYRPYKQKKKTRASVAIERGLEPLADLIMAQELKEYDDSLIMPYVNEEKGVVTVNDALNGACDIIAERISDDAALRKSLREMLFEAAKLTADINDKCEDEEKKRVYETYKEFSEPVKTIPSHRILAVNRGEKEDCLKVGVTQEQERALGLISAAYIKSSAFNDLLNRTVEDSYSRLLFPSLEREVRNELTDKASEQAIKMFEVNLKPLLMQPPLKGKVIMGFDPGYRMGCKIAVIDESGNYLAHTVVYPTPPKKQVEEAKAVLKALIEKYKVDVISIGNGTASKESEIFVAELIKELDRPVTYAVVNEAGASVYSANKLASEEFPDLDLNYRSAISIARRLMDPLAELIKIDVGSIGVGQYQHDMPQKRLTEALTGVVEDCVNSVGVNLNTASYELLSYVSGLNSGVAKNIVAYRKTQPFKTREQLLKVSKLGQKAFEQSAGFLRIVGGESVLDNTAVHPESYAVAENILKIFGYTDEDVKANKLGELHTKAKEYGLKKLSDEVGAGEMTVTDIIDELMKPGRDVRDSLPPPVLRSDIMDLNDLKPGMEVMGVVRNVIDFGAFVDIGVHQDGLVHKSQICDRFINHPSEVLTVGDRVKARVLEVDPVKKRISLSLRSGEKPQKRERTDGDRQGGTHRQSKQYDRPRNNAQREPQKELTLEEKLAALAGKFNKH